ncbi:MAG: isoprenylcysteine carboxylmethyltransferase family protein [Ignavibacteriales bacterium]|nr:isoprenylcysteine carboxylmethyltransferase family protein [Ignavibacteriales bacterium]
MDPINLIVAINLFVSMSSNLSGAKKGMKSKLSNVVKKPTTYLQKIPPNIAALVLILTIAAIFNLGVFGESIKQEYNYLRIIGLILFIIFSWVQVSSFKALGEFYSQDILIFKNHKLIKLGLYKYLRHPQYFSQILSDLGVGLALMGYLIIPIVIFIEIPLFILRAKAEENLLSAYFNEEFKEYKKKSGFFIPFIG